eukprot:5162998-Pyramimonas_sp.AAC.1
MPTTSTNPLDSRVTWGWGALAAGLQSGYVREERNSSGQDGSVPDEARSDTQLLDLDGGSQTLFSRRLQTPLAQASSKRSPPAIFVNAQRRVNVDTP